MTDNMKNLKAQIIIPTLNAGENLAALLDSIKIQQSVEVKVLIIDSESEDQTKEIAKKYHCQIKEIKRIEFNHGGTRQMGINLCSESEIIIFLTQDVILANEYAIKNILQCFINENVGCAYGRQLPHKNAGVLAAHARCFNYPSDSRLKSLEDVKKMGIKTAFISNSFAAYRRKALEDIDGFSSHLILSEDTYVAANMLLKNWINYYCAEAMVYHSHDYSYIQEFKRYFDIGVFYSREKWIREKFGQAEGEGIRFVISEVRYIWDRHRFYLLCPALIRTFLKYFGYKLGMHEKKLPIQVKKTLSMNQMYWNKYKCD